MKNWKTTLSGILHFLPGLLHVFFPQQVSAETAILLQGVIGGTGLMTASDAKKSLNQ